MTTRSAKYRHVKTISSRETTLEFMLTFGRYSAQMTLLFSSYDTIFVLQNVGQADMGTVSPDSIQQVSLGYTGTGDSGIDATTFAMMFWSESRTYKRYSVFRWCLEPCSLVSSSPVVTFVSVLASWCMIFWQLVMQQ